MALRFLVVALLAATASAFEIPASASRRSVLAKVAAAAPLAALAPAFADASNDFLGARGIDVKPTDATEKYLEDKARLSYNGRDSKLIDVNGAAVQKKALKGSAYAANNAAARKEAGIRIGGKYADPNHPGCKRKVTLIGTNKVLVEGADEDKVPFTVRGTYEGKTVTLDFSPKGGPKDVTAQYSITGLTFPDGNVWKKLS